MLPRNRTLTLDDNGNHWPQKLCLNLYCPLDIFKSRNPKRLYLKAYLGIIEDFTDISSRN